MDLSRDETKFRWSVWDAGMSGFLFLLFRGILCKWFNNADGWCHFRRKEKPQWIRPRIHFFQHALSNSRQLNTCALKPQAVFSNHFSKPFELVVINANQFAMFPLNPPFKSFPECLGCVKTFNKTECPDLKMAICDSYTTITPNLPLLEFFPSYKKVKELLFALLF